MLSLCVINSKFYLNWTFFFSIIEVFIVLSTYFILQKYCWKMCTVEGSILFSFLPVHWLRCLLSAKIAVALEQFLRHLRWTLSGYQILKEGMFIIGHFFELWMHDNICLISLHFMTEHLVSLCYDEYLLQATDGQAVVPNVSFLLANPARKQSVFSNLMALGGSYHNGGSVPQLTDIEKRLPEGAEVANVWVGSVSFLQSPIMVFVRLARKWTENYFP